MYEIMRYTPLLRILILYISDLVTAYKYPKHINMSSRYIVHYIFAFNTAILGLSWYQDSS
jgi:hypothetical protein